MPSQKIHFPVDWRLLVQECFDDFSCLDFFVGLVSLQTSLLCIKVELAEGGSVAVAAGISDR